MSAPGRPKTGGFFASVGSVRGRVGRGLAGGFYAWERGEAMEAGVLHASEIADRWRLKASLVVLSACQTGLGRRVLGERAIGLAHAFFAAGARSLLVGLWAVDDRATSLLITRLYGNLGGLSATEALRETKQWLREYEDESGSRPHESPFYWGGFVLIGAATRGAEGR